MVKFEFNDESENVILTYILKLFYFIKLGVLLIYVLLNLRIVSNIILYISNLLVAINKKPNFFAISFRYLTHRSRVLLIPLIRCDDEVPI